MAEFESFFIGIKKLKRVGRKRLDKSRVYLPNGDELVDVYKDNEDNYRFKYTNEKGQKRVKNLGRDYNKMLMRREQFVAQLKGEEFIRICKPPYKNGLTGKAEFDIEIEIEEGSKQDFGDTFKILDTLKVTDVDVPITQIMRIAGKYIKENPSTNLQKAAKMMGIPQIALINELPEPENSPTLIEIGEVTFKKKLNIRYMRNLKQSWRMFCDKVNCKKIVEVKQDAIDDYFEYIYDMYENNHLSTSWINPKYANVKTILNNWIKKTRVSGKQYVKLVIDYCKVLIPPTEICKPPKALEKEDFQKLIKIENKKWKAIFYLLINCGYYPVAAANVKKENMHVKKDITYITFPRTKNHHRRINVLWEETIRAIKEYQKEKPHKSQYIFVNKDGNKYTEDKMREKFKSIREELGVDESVKLMHFRDGAATAIYGEVEDILAKITMGHAVSGEIKKYIELKPEKVVKCATLIYKEYML